MDWSQPWRRDTFKLLTGAETHFVYLLPIWKSEMNNTMIINEPLDKPDVSQRHRVENHKVILDRYFRVI